MSVVFSAQPNLGLTRLLVLSTISAGDSRKMAATKPSAKASPTAAPRTTTGSILQLRQIGSLPGESLAPLPSMLPR